MASVIASASASSSASSDAASSYLEAKAYARDHPKAKPLKHASASASASALGSEFDGLVFKGYTVTSAEWERRRAAEEWQDLPGPNDPVSIAARAAGRRAITGEPAPHRAGAAQKGAKSSARKKAPKALTAAEERRLKKLHAMLDHTSPFPRLNFEGELALKTALRQKDSEMLRLIVKSVELTREILMGAVNAASFDLNAKDECARLMRWAIGRESLLEAEQRAGAEYAVASGALQRIRKSKGFRAAPSMAEAA